MEKQEQDVEGKSQAAKDHATDQETVAALSLEYLPKGKTDTQAVRASHGGMWEGAASSGPGQVFQQIEPLVAGTPWSRFKVMFPEETETPFYCEGWTR